MRRIERGARQRVRLGRLNSLEAKSKFLVRYCSTGLSFSPGFLTLKALIRILLFTGPTSMTHLLHSTATVPQRLFHSYDQRHHHTWEVGKTGDGFITVIEPSSHTEDASSPTAGSGGGGGGGGGGGSSHTTNHHGPGSSSSGFISLPRPVERDVLEKLINAYFQDVAPLVPIITASEFLASSSDTN